MNPQDDVQAAQEAGFDINLIEHSLALSPEQRLEEHQSALDLVWELEKARAQANEES